MRFLLLLTLLTPSLGFARRVEFFMSDYCTNEKRATVVFTEVFARDFVACGEARARLGKDTEIWAIRVDGSCQKIEAAPFLSACRNLLPPPARTELAVSYRKSCDDSTDEAVRFETVFSINEAENRNLCLGLFDKIRKDSYHYGEFKEPFTPNVVVLNGQDCVELTEETKAHSIPLYKHCLSLATGAAAKR